MLCPGTPLTSTRGLVAPVPGHPSLLLTGGRAAAGCLSRGHGSLALLPLPLAGSGFQVSSKERKTFCGCHARSLGEVWQRSEDTSFAGVTGAACCTQPAGHPDPPLNSSVKRNKRDIAQREPDSPGSKAACGLVAGAQCTAGLDSGGDRLILLCTLVLSPGGWTENRWKTFFKGNNEPQAVDKPEGIYSFIRSFTHSPPGRWGARVRHTHRGILSPGTEAVPTAFRDV